jgi:hypothetical protein
VQQGHTGAAGQRLAHSAVAGRSDQDQIGLALHREIVQATRSGAAGDRLRRRPRRLGGRIDLALPVGLGLVEA